MPDCVAAGSAAVLLFAPFQRRIALLRTMSQRNPRLLLLVESSDLGGILKLALGEFELEWHAEPGSAGDAFRRRSFDLAIVDLAFGGRPAGLGSIRDWRAAGADFPIIAISDLPQPSLAVESLDAGADDYLRKPFHHEELLLRIRKLLARSGRGLPVRKAGGVLLGRSTFVFGGATITPDLMIRFPDGEEERIRPKHQGILRMFAERTGGLVLKDELVKRVWGSDANDAGHSVNVYVSTLRRLFLRHKVDFNALVTSEPKAGWRIDAAAAGPAPDLEA
jgi:DNA-binding response OmpR family regulator